MSKSKLISIAVVVVLLLGAAAVAAHYRNQYVDAQEKANTADNERVLAIADAHGYKEAAEHRGELNEILLLELEEATGLCGKALQDLAKLSRDLRNTQSELGIVKGKNLTLEETITSMTQGGGTSEGEGTISIPCPQGTNLNLDIHIEADCQFSLVQTNRGLVSGKLFQEVALFDKTTNQIILGPVELDPIDLNINVFQNEDVEEPERRPRLWAAFIGIGLKGSDLEASLGVKRTLWRPNFLFNERLSLSAYGKIEVEADGFTTSSLNTDPKVGIKFSFEF